MNSMTERQRAVCASSLTNGHPLAVWRVPGGANFTISVSATKERFASVFGGDETPGFVIAPFDGEDGNQAYQMDADVILSGDQIWFRNGSHFALTPCSAEQAALASACPAKAQAPVWGDGAVATPDQTEYETLVAKVIDAIKQGACDKVVLSRIERRVLDADYDLCTMTEGLAAAYPNAFVALVSSSATGTWLVATPEVLLRQDAQGVETMALAGTQWPDADTDIATLVWPEKIIAEQKYVVDFIQEAFEAEGIAITHLTEPHTVRAANLCHLRSEFRAAEASDAQLANLLRRMHPTSAVCGTPKEEARKVIHTLEGTGRNFYTGYLGYRNIGAETALYVNLRSARVSGSEILIHVGGGIVEQSDPTLEWQETVAKTQTILRVV